MHHTEFTDSSTTSHTRSAVHSTRTFHSAAALVLLLLPLGCGMSSRLTAQETAPPAPPRTTAATRLGARLLVVFRPPARGTRRERALTRGGDGARALIPAERVDSLIPQTMRATPFVAVCAAGEPDSARLTVRVLPDSAGNGAMSAGAMIGLTAGLNRIALSTVNVPIVDGAIAEWSLSTRSGDVFLTERIQRQVVRATPTVNSLARNGIWYDALDLFVVDALRGIPLAAERLHTFLTGVGAESCAVAPPR
jgi:hypothetical protein